jgi:hypothetical protein
MRILGLLIILSCASLASPQVIALTRQKLFHAIQLLGQDTCIVHGNLLATTKVENPISCAFSCLKSAQLCTAFNFGSKTLTGFVCQLYSNVTYFAYNVTDCRAYQVRISFKLNTDQLLYEHSEGLLTAIHI